MSKVSEWIVPKWPFLLADFILITAAAVLVWKSKHPITPAEAGFVTAAVALGALLACLPYILEYRATSKLIELNALGEVAEKIQDLKHFTDRVSSATDQWARVQETTQGQAEKTIAAAGGIAERITSEVREFTEIQKKIACTAPSRKYIGPPYQVRNSRSSMRMPIVAEWGEASVIPT